MLNGRHRRLIHTPRFTLKQFFQDKKVCNPGFRLPSASRRPQARYISMPFDVAPVFAAPPLEFTARNFIAEHVDVQEATPYGTLS